MLALEPVLVLTLPNSLDAARAADLKPFGPALNLGQTAVESGARHVAISGRRAG